MTSQKRSTILAVTLLSITLTLSTTGCIQKKETHVRGVTHQAQSQQLGAKTVPFREQPTIQYTQPTIQYQQPTVQYSQPIITQQPTVQYTQPAVQYVEPVQERVHYVEQQTPVYEEEECTDDVSADCNRGSITKSQLSNQYVQQSSGGSMHTLKSVQGKTIQIGERSNGFTFPSYPGKVVILEMFGQNCPHCIKEIPTLKKIKSRYGSKIEVVAIHSQGAMGTSGAKRFIRQHRINYPIIDNTGATDLQYFIQNTYGWTGVLPFTMVIKDGQTEGSFGGEVSYKELREVIDPLF